MKKNLSSNSIKAIFLALTIGMSNSSVLYASNDITSIDTHASSTPAPATPAATLESKTISGTSGENLPDSDVSTIKITLTNDTFKDVDTSGNKNVTDWFRGLPSGLAAEISNVKTDSTEVTVKFTGAPTSSFSGAIQATIPDTKLTTSTSNLSVTPNPDAKFDIAAGASTPAPAISATLESKTISGVVGTPLVDADSTIKLTLAGDTFKDLTITNGSETVLTDWFTGLPTDVVAKATNLESSDSVLTITFSGTPSAASTAVMSVTIPNANLTTSTSDLTVTSNSDAKFNITDAVSSAPTATFSDVTISGTVGVALTDSSTATLTLTNDKFKDIVTTSGSETDLNSWFVSDSSSTLPADVTAIASAINADKTVLTIKFTGVPTAASDVALALTIPDTNLETKTTSLSSTLNSNAHFSIVSSAPSVNIDPKSITGKVSAPLNDTIILTLTNDTFKSLTTSADSGSEVTEWFGTTVSSDKTLPEGIVAQATALTDSDTKLTITLSGTPTTEIDKEIKVTIPAANLTSNTELSNTPSASTKITITAAPTAALEATTNISIPYGIEVPIDKTIKINLSNDTFKNVDTTTANKDLTSWFGEDPDNTLPTGVKAEVSAINNSNELTIKFVGLPTEVFDKEMKIVIPSEKLTSGAEVNVDVKNSKFIVPTPATLQDKTISGTTGVALAADSTIDLTLTSDGFNIANTSVDTDITSWFGETLNNSGITAKVSSLSNSNSKITIKFEGIPTKIISSPMDITVPNDNLNSSSNNIYVPENTNAKFNIVAGASAAITTPQKIIGTINESIKDTAENQIEISLTNDTFTDVDNSANKNITSWFGTNGLPTGVTAEVVSVTDSNKIKVKFTGNPTESFDKVMTITIPGSKLTNTDNSASVKVDVKNSSFYVNHYAYFTNKSIYGFINTQLPANSMVLLTLNDDTFEGINITSGSETDLSNWFANLPAGLTAKATDLQESNSELTITFSGTPTSTSSELIKVTIPHANLTGSSVDKTSAENSNTKFNIIDIPTATVSDKTISGTAGVELTADDKITITLQNDVFANLDTTENKNVTSWFGTNGLPTDVTAEVESISDDQSSVTIKFKGTPSAAFSKVMAITIPTSKLYSYTSDVTVTTNSNTKFDIAADTSSSVSATLESKTISGVVGTALTADSTIKLTLTGDTFKDLTTTSGSETVLTGWFTGLPTNVVAKATNLESSDSVLTITFSGTPSAASTAVMNVTIPNANLTTSTSDLTVTTNADAKFSITAATHSATLASKTINGFVGVNLSDDATITLTLANDKFKDIDTTSGSETDLSEWFKSGSNSTLPADVTAIASAINTEKTELTIKFTGTPSEVSDSVLNITIPAGSLESNSALTVTSNNSAKFNIVAISATVADKTISGTVGTDLSDDSTIVLTLVNDKFKDINTTGSNITNVQPWFGSSIPAGLQAKASSLNADKTELTIKFSSAPTAAVANKVMAISIPNTNLENSTNALIVTSNPNAKFNIAAATAPTVSATLANKTISGTAGTQLPDTATIKLTLTGDTFTGVTAADDISSWFGTNGLPTGVSAVVSSVETDNTAITIKFTGTPGEAFDKVMAVTIPHAKLSTTTSTDLTVATNNNAKFAIAANTSATPSATVADKTISGTVGTALTDDATITLTLSNDKFKGINVTSGNETTVKSWFGDTIPAGLEAKASAINTEKTQLTIKFTGAPTTEVSNKVMAITIPSGSLESNAALTVTSNDAAKFNIVAPAPSAALSESKTITGTVGTALATGTTISLTLANDTFKSSLANNTVVTEWFGTGDNRTLPEGIVATITNIDSAKKTATITFSSTPSEVFDKAMKISIPGSLLNTTADSSTLTVDTKSSKFKISEATASSTASLENKTISVISGTELPTTDAPTITLTITNDTFKDSVVDAVVTEWFGDSQNKTLPQGIVATITALDSTKKIATITFSGTASEEFNKNLKVSIPGDKLTSNSSTALVSQDNDQAKFVVTLGTVAKISNTVIKGKVDQSLTATVKLTLEDATFTAVTSSTNVSSWFTNLPKGLSAILEPISGENITTITIKISGTPKTKSSEAIKVTIPSSALNDIESDLTVEVNKAAKYDITAATSGGGSTGGSVSVGVSSDTTTTTTTETTTETTTDSTTDSAADDTNQESTDYNLSLKTVTLPEISDQEISFPDVPIDFWGKDPIEKLAKAGILNGTPSGFKPYASTKRGDVAIMLVKLLGLTGETEENFSDVEPSKYYAGYVGLAKAYKIVNGSDGKFNPEGFISRQDTMVIIANILKGLGIANVPTSSVLDGFTDKENISHYALESVEILVSQGIISGNNGKINPKDQVTRAEMAVIMSKIYDLINQYKTEGTQETQIEEIQLNNEETGVTGEVEEAQPETSN